MSLSDQGETNMNEVDSKRSRRRLGGIVALAAGVALLIGGGTYSLWSDSASITSGATITAGDLDINAIGDNGFWDVSGDRAGDQTTVVPGTAGLLGHSIDASTYRVVPGDEVAGVFQYQATLQGDNLVAELRLSQGITDTGTAGSMKYYYQLFDQSGNALTGHEEMGTAALSDPIAYLQAPETGQASGENDYINGNLVPIVTAPADANTVNLTLVLFASFQNVANQTDVKEVLTTLGNVQLTLTQVRNASTPSPAPTV
jgi:alternate signal-mediated exported protein